MEESSLLLCDEDWLRISPVQPYPIHKDDDDDDDDDSVSRRSTTNVVVGSFYTTTTTTTRETREDRENALKVLLQKEKEIGYMPEAAGYIERLYSLDLMTTRFKAVRWFIKSQCRFNLSLGTVFNAVNYFDRFVSAEYSEKWENWMIEWVSVACLSIAAKFGEVSIPQLQIWEDHELWLKPITPTIQSMELKVLKALGWRLNCVTPYSYVDLLTCQLDSLIQPSQVQVDSSFRLTELILLATLSNPKFLEFRPCTIAVSAFRCCLEEMFPSKTDKHLSINIQHLIPPELKDDMDKCYKAMEEHLADPLYNGMTFGHSCGPSSPITLITKETTLDRLALFDLHCCCLNSNPKKRRREEEEECTVSS
ncbi:putative cyclin-D7-1 [Telopea speciosissima]|uniref:putative cyclin-D7-1 n=1 Tax=Telopea speciosissima TaxID=54955 RepID=UPI001CC6D6F6|nr:putative cyclin-D7-1 [Telopea speciosissima]